MKQQDIREASLHGLSELLSSWGQPSFRAKQIYAWLWQHNAQSFEEMTNLPIVLREKLNEYFIFLNRNRIIRNFINWAKIKFIVYLFICIYYYYIDFVRL